MNNITKKEITQGVKILLMAPVVCLGLPFIVGASVTLAVTNHVLSEVDKFIGDLLGM